MRNPCLTADLRIVFATWPYQISIQRQSSRCLGPQSVERAVQECEKRTGICPGKERNVKLLPCKEARDCECILRKYLTVRVRLHHHPRREETVLDFSPLRCGGLSKFLPKEDKGSGTGKTG